MKEWRLTGQKGDNILALPAGGDAAARGGEGPVVEPLQAAEHDLAQHLRQVAGLPQGGGDEHQTEVVGIPRLRRPGKWPPPPAAMPLL